MKKNLMVTTLAMAVALSGCAAGHEKTGQGMAIGAVAGGLVGQIIGHNTTSTLIGAAIGTAIGGAIGSHLDQIAAESAKQLKLNEKGVSADNKIAQKTSPQGISYRLADDVMFDKSSAKLEDHAAQKLAVIANSIRNLDDGSYVVFVTGHTDESGNDAINIPLSHARAQAVADYLAGSSQKTKFDVRGFADLYPMAGLSSSDIENRRVEIQIIKIDSNLNTAIEQRSKIEDKLNAQLKAATAKRTKTTSKKTPSQTAFKLNKEMVADNSPVLLALNNYKPQF